MSPKRSRKAGDPDPCSADALDPAPIGLTGSEDEAPANFRIEPLLARRKLIWGALLWVLLLSYWPALKAPFLYDDIPNIVTNMDLRHPGEPGRFFRSHYSTMQFDHRPIAGLLTMVNYQLAGLSVLPYRVLNIVLHWLTAIALGEFILAFGRHFRIRAAAYLALPAALLWALHPLNSVTVIFISGRTEILMSLFFVLALRCVLEARADRSRRWLWLCLGCSVASLASKETGIGLIVALLILDRVAHFRSWKQALQSRRAFYAGLLAISIAFIAWWSTGERIAELGGNELANPWEYFKVQAGVILDYIAKVVWPRNLVFVHQGSVVATIGEWLPQMILLTAALLACLWFGRNRPALLVPGLLFFLVLGPTSSLLPIPQEPAAEWRMYLPSSCVLILLLSLCAIVVRSVPDRTPRVVVVGVCLLAGGLLTATFFRASTFASSIRIWEDTVRKEPFNLKGWHNLAIAHLDAGNLGPARKCAAILHQQGRRTGDVYLHSSGFQLEGMIALRAKNYDVAESMFRKGLEAYPGDEKLQGELLRIGLAKALLGLKRFEDALVILEALDRRHPENLSILEPLAQGFEGLGRMDEARALRRRLKGSGLPSLR